ncbi:hypothetical protein HDR58_04715 [bacterium]|nr:hypothetical protein [bacterium]
MKKIIINLVLIALTICNLQIQVQAVQFDVIVLPTKLFSVCDNYFCFPEASEIIAEDTIRNLNSYKNIHAIELAQVRSKLNNDKQLKALTEKTLLKFEESEKIDFQSLQKISTAFGAKSAILISSYAQNDQSTTKRDLWEVLEISSAFKTSYPYTLSTIAVLTDSVNNIVMWSGKYNKLLTNTEGYFLATNQASATSQLEKIRLYSKTNIAQNISQNIHLRFFPKDVRTFKVNKTDDNEKEVNKFVPNALDHLIKPQMIKEIEEGNINTLNPADDFIFEF